MCVQKRELSELDIYHRILRFKNYTVAMINKSLLPVRLRVPFFGDMIFLTQGLKYNFELILFWGPLSLFQNKWSLHPKYKRAANRQELAKQLSRVILLTGLVNLLLCPFVLVWQVLYAFFSYAEVIKREPGSLGARRWSLYGRLYLRHFNELDHELQGRLGRGYKPAAKYMNAFVSPLLAVFAKNVAFFSGSVLAVLIALTVYDEDVLTVQHILTAITVLGVVITITRSFIPDEHMVWCPEQLLQCVLAHIHYMPDHWKGNANKSETRDEMAQLFQYKAPDNLLASVLAHPVLTASGLPGRNRRFIPPSSAASAAASVLASLSTSQQPHASRSRSHTLLPSRQHHDGTMYCSDHTMGDSMSASDSRMLSQSYSALASEFASAEMSLHAIYMHEVHQQKTQHASGPFQASVPMRDLSTNSAVFVDFWELWPYFGLKSFNQACWDATRMSFKEPVGAVRFSGCTVFCFRGTVT
ncbi:autophagy-related 9A-like protein [Labeo rohita]|uniref:Autophagy-related protein 9 n=1 Tax=Labeo rohita TaxID=84645 RepID=A0A498MYT4_LABRO|nr:autophagy-related 9A-like protein [Labeo rohita]